MRTLTLGLFLFGFCLPLLVKGQGNTAAIKGLVKDNSATLPSASVHIVGSKFTTITDIDGKFSLVNLQAGNYSLVVSYLGYKPDTISISLQAGEKLTLPTIVLEQSGYATKAVQVKGIVKQSETRAINIMRNASNVVTVLSAEGIGKLPDRNAAEALQRAPAVAMEKNHGEGRYVSLRGTPTEWSSALLNGDRLPVTDEESKTRALPFDILPTDIIEYIA